MSDNAEQHRHPDIEIYLAGLKAEQAQAWLEHRFDRLEQIHQQGKQTSYHAYSGATRIPVMVVEKAAGKYTSIWFDSDATPWTQDRDCARDAARYFEREVRCIAGGWNEGDDPDEWWSVTPTEEQLINWKSA